MKKNITFAMILVIFVLNCNKPSHQQLENTTNQLIIRFKDTASQAAIDSLTAEMNLQHVSDIPELNIKVYKLASGMTLEKAIQGCQKNPHVQYAEPDYRVRTLERNRNPE